MKNYKLLVVILGVVFAGILAANILMLKGQDIKLDKKSFSIISEVSAEEIYPMFVCPCCGQPLDKKNICCDAAKDMIDFIDSQVSDGLSKEQIVLKTAEKYGITSVITSERDKIKNELAKQNPELFPKESLSFNAAVGKKAPEFILEDINGKTIKLADLRGKVVVLFFNEGSMCYPACWDEMAALANDTRLNSDKIETFSVLVDSKGEWQDIVKKVSKLAKAEILFDQTKAVSLAYDVLSLPSSMHQGSFPGHTYFVIDKEGIVRYTLDDPNMGNWSDKIFSQAESLTN